MAERENLRMFSRRHLSQAIVFCLLVGTFATFYPIRNATEQLNNKEAIAFGSSSVKYLSVGLDSACAITTSGGLMCWGNNDYGNLGDNTYLDRTSPVAVSGLTSGVTAVAVGEYHTCALTSAGAVKCWGFNDRGQLGDGTTTLRTTPVAVSGLSSGVTAITAGEYHTCALMTAGGVKCWGANTDSQLGLGGGLGSPAWSLTPQNVSGLTSGVSTISAGGTNTCALTTAGGVKCWGDNQYSQLGNGLAPTDSSTPQDVTGLTSGVSDIALGKWHACVRTTDNNVKCWGSNSGRLGNNSDSDSQSPVTVHTSSSSTAPLGSVSAVAAGGYHSCVVLADSGVKCWGSNGHGQVGDGSTTKRSTPVDVRESTSSSVPLTGVSAIATGLNFTCALMNSGGVKCWGNGGNGQLGAGNTSTFNAPVNVSAVGVSFGADTTAPTFSAAAVNSAGTQVIVGFSEVLSATAPSAGSFSLEVNGSSRTPTALTIADSTVVLTTSPAITAGQTVTISYTDPTAGNDANAIQDSSGNDASSIATTSVSNHVVTSSLSVGNIFSCAVTSTGGVKCWGYGYDGQLGNGLTPSYQYTPVNVLMSPSSAALSGVSAIASGYYQSCALTTTGGVKCWGYNSKGELGNGSTTRQTTAVDVTGLTSGVTAIALGGQHSCALTTGGSVKCWGLNNYGQLGDGTRSDKSTPVDVTGLTNVSAIALGDFHSCALTTTGGVKCWGWSGDGQLGDGSTTMSTSPVDVTGLTSGVTAIALGGKHSCALITGGSVKCWGDNASGQLGNGSTTDRTTAVDVHTSSSSSTAISGVSAIALGGDHSCALTTGGSVKCWGENNFGQLGNGSTTRQTTAVDVHTSSSSSTAISGVSAIALGDTHSCALTTTGGVKCWGRGDYGQLGNGLGTDQSTPVDVSVSGFSFGADTTAPTFSAAAVNVEGTTITLTYSEALSATTAGTSDFAVLVGGVSRSVSSVAVSGSTVVLTLASPAVETGQSVSVAYTQPAGSNAVKDSAGNKASSLSSTSVTNNSTVDTSGPSFVSAATNTAGTEITLTYSEALSATTAGTSDFTVLVGGVSRSVSSVAVSGSTVVLTLASAVGAGQSVSVAYTDPTGSNDTNAVQDSAGNDAATLAATSVTNNSTVDQTAPTLVSASTDVAGRTITLTYSETLGGTMASTGAFAVRVGGVSCSINSAIRSGSTVELTLASCSIASGQEVTVAYTDPSVSNDSTAVQDAAGNDAATLAATSVTNNSTVDSTVPSFVSAATNAAGTTITLTYSEALSATTAGASDFAVTVGGVSRSVSSVAVSGSTVVLTLSSAVGAGQSVSVAYTDPTGSNDTNALQDAAGNDAATLAATSVTNNSTVDQSVPTFVSAATNAAGTTITLTYSEALSATTAGASDFAVTVSGVSRSVSSVAVSGSTVVLTLSSAVGAGQSVSVAYTDPTGSNDTNALQDAAGNDAATLAATSVTNSVLAPSSGGSPDPGTTTTTTTSTTVAPTATTTTTVAPTTATVRSGTTVPRRTTTTTVVNRTTTTTIRATTTTTAFRPLEPLAPIVSTTTSVLSPTTSTAKASVTSVAISSIESLQQAEVRLKAVEAQTSTANNDLRIAQIKMGESIVAVLDPKSALAVAVNVAEEKVASLSAANASAEQIAAAVNQLENLKIVISQNVSLSIEKIAEAQSKLAAVLANPAATAQQVAAAKAELVGARVPDIGVVANVLTIARSDAHLQPVIIPGVVDNPGTGRIVLLDGAAAKNIEITRINGTSLRMTSTDGFRLVISTRDKNGDPVQFNSRGGIVVKHGNLISIAGEGFAPGTTAKTWLFSSPRELGNLNVSPNGSFAADFPITDDIRVGNHTAQVNGLSPDGEVRSLSLDVEILPNDGPAPYDPLANRLAVAALIAQAMALLALSRRKDNDGDDRDQADVSEVSVDHVVGSDGNKRDVYSPPVLQSLDQFLQRIPSRLATTQQLLARIVHDAVYLRALTGVGGAVFAFTGVVVGFFAAQSANFAGQSPSFVWIAALVVLGSLDALSGGLAALTIVITTGIAGGLNSTDSIRGLLGLTVMCFAIPLVASTTRPFRRAASDSVDRLWKRASDLMLIAVFGAWAAGAMYDALPGLYGFTSLAAGRTTTIQLLVFGTLVLRFGLESLATRVTGQRLTYLVGATLPDSTQGRTVLSILVRTIIMVFVAEAFIGNNIALWIGAGMYAIPKLIATRAEHFPKSALLNTWLPSGLLRTVVMLFVARWWASNISSFSEDPSTQLQAAFVLLGIPALVLTSLGWFAGGGRNWRSTPVSKVLGIVVLAIGVLTVRGVLFA
jgi:uncharacterized repeat protein (TIGR02059 family)